MEFHCCVIHTEILLSLLATIKKEAPHILLKDKAVDPLRAIPTQIPEILPENNEIPTIEGIGQPVTACFFTMSTVDPVSWYVYFQGRTCMTHIPI